MSHLSKGLGEQLFKLKVSEGSIELIEKILETADDLFSSVAAYAAQSDVPQTFFIIHDKGVEPLIVDNLVAKMGAMEEERAKDFIAQVICNLCQNMHALAVIHIAEAWALSGDLNESDLEFVRKHGVRNHPKAEDSLYCHLDINCKGKHHAFMNRFLIKPGNDARILESPHEWEHSDKATGRFVVGSEFLQPLE